MGQVVVPAGGGRVAKLARAHFQPGAYLELAAVPGAVVARSGALDPPVSLHQRMSRTWPHPPVSCAGVGTPSPLQGIVGRGLPQALGSTPRPRKRGGLPLFPSEVGRMQKGRMAVNNLPVSQVTEGASGTNGGSRLMARGWLPGRIAMPRNCMGSRGWDPPLPNLRNGVAGPTRAPDGEASTPIGSRLRPDGV